MCSVVIVTEVKVEDAKQETRVEEEPRQEPNGIAKEEAESQPQQQQQQQQPEEEVTEKKAEDNPTFEEIQLEPVKTEETAEEWS